MFEKKIKMILKIFLFFSIVLLSACNSQQPDEEILTVIKGGTILDLSNQGKSTNDIQNSYVIFKGNKILEIGLLSVKDEYHLWIFPD